ncbi:hypothetical protein RRG08_014616 [Elysia crispata]|uniref:Uncharacterized protein n=1 Tax=Elysia crispata TaxID=231223 RepID=A0AAE1D459_9GAST|nr:hypothetical protein RRG08_014616 [Elysia crispata]
MAVDLQYYRSQTPPSLMWRASALTYGRRSPVLPVQAPPCRMREIRATTIWVFPAPWAAAKSKSIIGPYRVTIRRSPNFRSTAVNIDATTGDLTSVPDITWPRSGYHMAKLDFCFSGVGSGYHMAKLDFCFSGVGSGHHMAKLDFCFSGVGSGYHMAKLDFCFSGVGSEHHMAKLDFCFPGVGFLDLAS